MPARGRTPQRSAEQIVGAAAASLGDAPDLPAILQGIAAAACTALGADRASCYAYDRETGLVSAVYTTEDDPKRRAFLQRTVGMGADRLPIWRLQLDRPDPLMTVDDTAADPAVPAALAARLGSGAFLGVRLEHLSVRSDGVPALLGTLFCSYNHPRHFSDTERQTARGLAALAALALANARLQAETALSLAAASAASETSHRQRDYSNALVASMQDGLTVLSPEGRLLEVSPSFCRLTGFSAEELIGQGCPYPYWPDADPERVEDGFRRLRETGPAEWDLEFRRKNGERFPVILAGSLVRGQDGEVVGYLGTVKDITERKRAERRLRASVAQNKALAAEQAALRRVATAVAAEAPPEEVFALVAREVASLLGAAAGGVVRFGPEEGVVVGDVGHRGRRGPGVGHRRAPGRGERHRPCLPERRARADGRLRPPGRGDPQSWSPHCRIAAGRRPRSGSVRASGGAIGVLSHRDAPLDGGGGAAVGQLRGARRGGDRQRRGSGEARGPGGHRPADGPRQPPGLLRAPVRRRRAGPPPRAPAQPGDHGPGPLQARQRLPRPSDRGPGARGGRGAAERADPCRGHARPGGGRGVRLAPPRERRSRGAGRPPSGRGWRSPRPPSQAPAG